MSDHGGEATDGGRVRDAGFDEWLDALDAGEGYFLACPEGHGSLPPRRACPDCGSPDLSESSLPEGGVVDTFTVVEVATPTFQGDAPYVTAIASFGPVRLTGLLRGVDPASVEVGQPVGYDVDTNRDGERHVVLVPR